MTSVPSTLYVMFWRHAVHKLRMCAHYVQSARLGHVYAQPRKWRRGDGCVVIVPKDHYTFVPRRRLRGIRWVHFVCFLYINICCILSDALAAIHATDYISYKRFELSTIDRSWRDIVCRRLKYLRLKLSNAPDAHDIPKKVHAVILSVRSLSVILSKGRITHSLTDVHTVCEYISQTTICKLILSIHQSLTILYM